MPEITYRSALKEALREALTADPRVFLMGEDVGAYGGAYGISKDLLKDFGPERIRDAPLSESGFVGAAIGCAMTGMLPIVEIMTVNFSLLALDQIIHNAATLRHMSAGQWDSPLVIRTTTGGGRQLAAQHSHSWEGWLAHIPGLKIVTPATLDDARFMLAAALKDPNPVMLFEHAMLFGTTGSLTPDLREVPLEGAAIRRSGRDITIITYGGSLPKVLAAADALGSKGTSCEVIDLRCLRPLDDGTVVASVRRTKRALIVDEGWRSVSLAAEISARLMEQTFGVLAAPVARLCSAEVPIPYSKHLEDEVIPNIPAIIRAVEGVTRRDL